MAEIFTFAPTDYEIEAAKHAKQTPKQLAKEFQKQYQIALRSATAGKQTAGGQLVNLKNAARICEQYGQPIPDDLKCMIALYERAQAQHVEQARWEEENSVYRYPRKERETVSVWLNNKKGKNGKAKPTQPALLEVA